jgi:hypothetical protein
MGGRGGAGRAKRARTDADTATDTARQDAPPPAPPPPAPPEQVPDPVDPRTATVNRRFDRFLHGVIADLATRPGDWVGLIDIRAALDARGISREAQDEHLRRLSRDGTLHLAPESNRKVLTDVDHAASIRIGGEDQHIVMWEPTQKPPGQT